MARRKTKCVTEVPGHIKQAVINELTTHLNKPDVALNDWIKSYWDEGVEVVATRTAFEWFAILFKNKNGGLFYADFNGYGTDAENWHISNDSEDIGSVDEFLNAELARGFF